MVDLIPTTAAEIAKTAIAFILIVFIVASCMSPLLSQDKYYREVAVKNFDNLMFNINISVASKQLLTYKQVTMFYPDGYYVYAFNRYDSAFDDKRPQACGKLPCFCLFSEEYDKNKQENNEKNAVKCKTLSYSENKVAKQIAIAPNYLQVEQAHGQELTGIQKVILFGSGNQFSTSMYLAVSKTPGSLGIVDSADIRTLAYDIVIGAYPGNADHKIDVADAKDPTCPAEQKKPCGTTAVKIQFTDSFKLNYCYGTICGTNGVCKATAAGSTTYECVDPNAQPQTTSPVKPQNSPPDGENP